MSSNQTFSANNPLPQPEPPADGEVSELVALIRQIALAWEPDACLLGNMTAKQLARAADLLERRAQPVPVGPKDFELVRAIPDWWPSTDAPRYDLDDSNPEQPLFSVFQDDVVEYARAVLARWGQPTPQPTPLSERLPGAEDLDHEGTCWMWHPINFHYCLCRPDPSVHTHWLAAHALPIPRQPAPDAPAP